MEQQQFDTFLTGIGLFGSAADALRVSYTQDASAKLDLACQAAQLSLGVNSVNTAPLDQTVVERNWSRANTAEPYCIVQPASADDVSKLLKILSYFQIKFAVRSGGHSPNPGFSSIGKAGVLLDLQKLNQVTVSADETIASLGPGARWGDVINVLDTHGKTVVGGRVPDVGVGGLMLAGGVSHFSGEYGLAVDNVKNFEVVLSDGTVTNANSEQNADLFWALKGGGPNFGIVTRFDLRTIPVREIWLQVTVHSVDQADEILDAFVKWQTNGALDSRSTVLMGFGLDAVSLGLLYASPADQQPDAFSPFNHIVPIAVLAPGMNSTVAAVTAIMGTATAGAGTRHDYRAASSRIDAQLFKEMYTFWREKGLAVREATGANQTFVLQPIPKRLVEQGMANGGNPMGLAVEDQQWWTSLIDWTEEADDDAVRAVSIATTEQWKNLGEERGLYLPYLYQGDASRDQNPLASYGAENVAKLKEIALKYDPAQVFQKLQNDGFLLSKV
ncbi:FAD-binding domain-containing protein [Thozetella sp. PMI_491]|nr:FAD-binding domain-containing protein [Thozetella sp. PMI_491]